MNFIFALTAFGQLDCNVLVKKKGERKRESQVLVYNYSLKMVMKAIYKTKKSINRIYGLRQIDNGLLKNVYKIYIVV